MYNLPNLLALKSLHQQAMLRLSFETDAGQQIGADMLALPLIAADGVTTHVLGGLFPSATQDIRHYTSIRPVEVSFARFLGSETEQPALKQAATQARRKFRVISGGLDLS